MDCDDGEATVHPDAVEICNGLDDDCDTSTWAEGEDDDGDGFPDADCGGVDCYDSHSTAGPEFCNAIAVFAGIQHSCALDAAGIVRCWGDNARGQSSGVRGTGTPFPTVVSGVTSVRDLALTSSSTCAVIDDGSVVCWGNLGAADGSPVTIAGLSGVRGVTAGTGHVCAVVEDGTVWCWGSNLEGQLGDGTRMFRGAPVMAMGLSEVVQVTAGFEFTCARTGGGLAYCWGDNSYGQLGDGTTTDRLSPVRAIGASDAWRDIDAGGRHVCGLAGSSGRPRCWGANTYGQLGDGTTTDRDYAQPVWVTLSDAVQVSAGGFHTCATTMSGGIACWGFNDRGQIGDGSTTVHLRPTLISVSGATLVSAGTGHTCGLRSTGEISCWGDNRAFQLGDGSGIDRLEPMPIRP